MTETATGSIHDLLRKKVTFGTPTYILDFVRKESIKSQFLELIGKMLIHHLTL